jgi:sugar (pentulose or hexulose) kinase
MMSFLLGLDIGTTSVKAAIFDLAGKCLAIGSQDYRLDTPAPDRVELDPERYWMSACEVVQQAVVGAGVAPEAILAVGVSSQGETTICVDPEGKPLYPALVWLDHRAQAEARALDAILGEEVYARTGIPTIDPTWTACKIAWIRDHEPEIFQRTHQFLLAQNFIVQRMTGAFVTDGGVACTSMLLDISTHTWWDRAMEAVGLSPEQLPDLRHLGEVAGPLTRQAATSMGLSPGLPVVLAGMDQIAGAVGAGNLSSEIISESTGGALTLHVTVGRRDLDPEGRIPVYLHALPGMYLFDPVCETGGMALKWFRDEFCQQEMALAQAGNKDSYDLITALAGEIAPGCEGLVMLPHLTGAFSPEYEPSARGIFAGFTLAHTKGHFARSVLEAVAFMLRRNIELVRSSGIQLQEIRATGGGARSHLWRQIKADICQLPVVSLQVEDTALLGDAMLAALAVGAFGDLHEAADAMVVLGERVHPNPNNREVYDAAFHRYVRTFEAMVPIFRQPIK